MHLWHTEKKFTVLRLKVLYDALCNFRLTLSMIDLYRKMRHRCVCVMNSFDLYFTPRAISSKTSPFYFIRISQSRYFLVAEKHLFEASFASKCKLFDKDESDIYHKDLIRKQNLALS